MLPPRPEKRRREFSHSKHQNPSLFTRELQRDLLFIKRPTYRPNGVPGIKDPVARDVPVLKRGISLTERASFSKIPSNTCRWLRSWNRNLKRRSSC